MNFRILFTAITCAVLLVGCGQAPQGEATPPSIMAVRLHTVADTSPSVSRHFVGRVDAVSTVDLAFQVSGRLIDLPVQQGEIIPRGELLAALDPTDYDLALREAEVQWRQAQSEYDRSRLLLDQGHLSSSAFERIQTKFDSATVSRQKAQQNLQYTRLLAPFDALITRRLAEQYSTIQAGMPLVRVQDVTELRVNINVPEQMMRTRNASSIHEYRITAHLSEHDSAEYPLTYREHATEVDPVTQTYLVSFGLQRPPQLNLLPGMTISVHVARKQPLEGDILIPIAALDTSVPEQFRVWRYDPSTQTVAPLPVQVGTFQNGSVRVTQGLMSGDQIVAAGIHLLRSGQQVRPFETF